MTNTQNIINRYNRYLNQMVENAKRLTNEESCSYIAAFEGKVAIERTLSDFGYKFTFSDDCFADGITDKGQA